MDYFTFMRFVIEKLIDYLPEEYADYEVEHQTVLEINQMIDVVNIVAPGKRGGQIAPSISIFRMYEEYLVSFNHDEVMRNTAERVVYALKNKPNEIGNIDLMNCKDRIIMMLVDPKKNKEYLETVPHRAFHGLSVVYRILVESGEYKLISNPITNKLAMYIGMDEQELYDAAIENTRILLPPEIKAVGEYFHGLAQKCDFIEDMPEDINPDDGMYVITNPSGMNGAAFMLYDDVLYQLAEKVNSNLYLFPASIYELLVTPVDNKNLDEMEELIFMSQEEDMMPEERLSRQIYCYDKDARTITLVS